MKDCINKNQSKNDPAAYCATIMRKVEGEEKTKFNFSTVIEQAQDVQELTNTSSKGIMVKGTAIKEVVSRNGVKYLAKELEKATPTLRGKPILKNHQNNVDSIVGKVFDSSYNSQEKSIEFKGLVTDSKVKELIQDGLINHVSIGASAKLRQEENESGEKCMIAEDLEILELSVTPVPGVPSASIMAGESFAIAIQEAYNEAKHEEEMLECPECKKMIPEKEMKEHMKTDHDKETENVLNTNKEKNLIEVKQKMENEEKFVKNILVESVMMLNEDWTRTELESLDLTSLKTLLKKAQESLQKKTVKTEEKVEPKGMISQPVIQEVTPIVNDVITMIASEGNDGMRLKGIKPNTFVVERKSGNKCDVWRMPDYKKQLYKRN